MLSPTGGKLHACVWCKNLKKAGNLKRHIRIYTGGKSHSLKEIISQTDQYLVSLSSKRMFLKTN